MLGFWSQECRHHFHFDSVCNSFVTALAFSARQSISVQYFDSSACDDFKLAPTTTASWAAVHLKKYWKLTTTVFNVAGICLHLSCVVRCTVRNVGAVPALLISHACRATICPEYILHSTTGFVIYHLCTGCMTSAERLLSRKGHYGQQLPQTRTISCTLRHMKHVFVTWSAPQATQELRDAEEEKCQGELGHAVSQESDSKTLFVYFLLPDKMVLLNEATARSRLASLDCCFYSFVLCRQMLHITVVTGACRLILFLFKWSQVTSFLSLFQS